MKKTLFVITPNGRRYRIQGFCYAGDEERDWTSVLDRKDGPNKWIHMPNAELETLGELGTMYKKSSPSFISANLCLDEILRHLENIYGKDGFSWLCLA